MFTRRGFAACAFCAVPGFAAQGADNAAPGVKPTFLSQNDGPTASNPPV